MIAALPALIPATVLSWIEVGTVNISEFICSIQLLLDKITDSVIDSLSNALGNNHRSARERLPTFLFSLRKTDAGWTLTERDVHRGKTSPSKCCFEFNC